MKKLSQLGGVRIVALAVLLVQNAYVIRHLPLDEIGKYYLIATVAYLGNAAIFVGSDLAFQRKIHNLPNDLKLDLPSLIRYILRTGVPGCLIVAVASTLYFNLTNQHSSTLPLTCCLVALSTYFSTLCRNIVLLCDKAVQSSMLQLIEAVAKMSFVIAAGHFSHPTGERFAVAGAAAAMSAGAAGLFILRRTTTPTKKEYSDNPMAWARTLVVVGGGGLLNWTQLQGYRPLAAAVFQSNEIIGAVSALTALGATAAGAVCSLVGQMYIPLQYASKGATTAKYIKVLLLSSGCAALVFTPISYGFLWLTNKLVLAPYLYLVPIGMLVETGNAVMGAAINHCNVNLRSLRHLSLAGLLGCMVTGSVLSLLPTTQHAHALIGAALVLGQLTAVFCTLHYSFPDSTLANAKP